jgi:oxygen-dependent protoporphyrinogen oxidase
VGKRVAVLGGGIAGLAAAVRVRDLAPAGTEIVVYEQSDVLGGKLRTGRLGGLTVERGAESFLMSAPDGGESAAVRLVRRLGLGDALVHPAAVPAAVASPDGLASFPTGTLMGIPAIGDEDTGGRPLLRDGEDVAVGQLVRARFGDDVVDDLVDPMLGGVYAGRADLLSLATTLPALAAAARDQHSLAGAVRVALDRAAAVRVAGRPVFGALDGGMNRLVAAAAAEGGARISLGLPVRALASTPRGWRLLLGPVPAPRTDDVDAVILAVPAKAAALLLSGVDATAAAAVGVLSYASVALAGFAFAPGTDLPDLSGFLVPPRLGTLVKAATFFSRKWPHLPPSSVIVRASLGRAGEEAKLQQDDHQLLAIAHAELGRLIGKELPHPVDSWVQRWGGGLPQYAPGHLDRVAAARAALADRPGLALAGAAYDGVGIPACVASGYRAAEDVCKILEDS